MPEIRNFVANLFKAQEDIFRIIRLFTETFKSAFLGAKEGVAPPRTPKPPPS